MNYGRNKWTSLLLSLAAVGCADPLAQKCSELSASHVADQKERFKKDYTLLSADGFYSKKLDSCIHTELAEVGVSAEIRDLSGTILRDGGGRNILMSCDPDGANSVILSKVRDLHGYVYNAQYSIYLDDGFGGPPATLKTPQVPYTKELCRKVFDKWIADLR